MIRDLSETLHGLLKDPGLKAKFPQLAEAQIVFDRPEQLNPSQTTVDLFLYDIRENLELRSNEPRVERNNGKATIQPPPLRVACSYLITAWPVGDPEVPLQEHRLLSQTLQVLSHYPTIPPARLKGSLQGQQPPLPMMTAQTDGLKDPAEFWTAIGGKLRPSITVTVTIAMERFEPVTKPLVITEQIRLGERTGPKDQEFFRIGGRVTAADNKPVAGAMAANNKPVAGATVTLVEAGFTTRTDADGYYIFDNLKQGVYNLHIQVGTTKKSVTITVPASGGKTYDVQL